MEHRDSIFGVSEDTFQEEEGAGGGEEGGGGGGGMSGTRGGRIVLDLSFDQGESVV